MDVPEIPQDAVSGRGMVHAPPGWLRHLGRSAWLLVGVVLLVVGVVWLLALTQAITMPLIAAGVVAAVASPVVAWLSRGRLPRGAATALLMLGLIVLGAALIVVIVLGISSESARLSELFAGAEQKVQGWLQDLGVSSGSASGATSDAHSGASSVGQALLHGISVGIEKLSSLVFFLALTVLSLFFLLKDGPTIRAWGERRMGVPLPVARIVTRRVLGSLRAYFLGVTIIALFNAVLVGGASLIIGIPMAGTIALVTFVGAYIPYLGAWTAGAFSVLLALGGAGTDAAIAMIVVQLLANGILQQLVQPVAYGAALGIHPLAVLVVTIGGGALFGAAGLILGAPLVSAITKITRDLNAGVPPDDIAPANSG